MTECLRLMVNIAQRSKEPPFTEEEFANYRHIILEQVSDKMRDPSENRGTALHVESEQPFLLNLLQDCAEFASDPDAQMASGSRSSLHRLL